MPQRVRDLAYLYDNTEGSTVLSVVDSSIFRLKDE